MQFPTFLGIRDLADLTVLKFNSAIRDIYDWWNDHDNGSRFWNAISTMNINTTVVTKTSAYTPTNTDVVILVNSTAGIVTITLPTAVNIPGRWYFIKDWKGQAGTNNITIATTSAQTIDGSTTKVLNKAYLGYFVVSDGANWSTMSTEAVLGNYLPLAGGTMSGAIAMGSNKITGLAAATANGDALRYEQLIGLYLLLSGGTMSGAIDMGSHKITSLTNGSAAADAAAFGQIKVIQTVISSQTGQANTTSSTFGNSGFSVTITPTSSSNRILLFFSTSLFSTTAANQAMITFMRGTTNLGGADGFAKAASAAANLFTGCCIVHIDSPATTSATTYNIYERNSNNVNSAGFGDTNLTSVYIAMEIV